MKMTKTGSKLEDSRFGFRLWPRYVGGGFWNKDHFEVHHQDENGLFASEAKTFTTDVAFDSDGFYSIGLDASGEEWTALHALGDLNGDGVADLVALSPEPRRLCGVAGCSSGDGLNRERSF